MSEITVNDKGCHEPAHTVTCPTTTDKSVVISVPASVRTYADVGAVEAYCSCEPVVTPGWHPHGQKCGFCAFTVKQEIFVRLPITFGAEVYVGDAYTDCDGAAPYPPHGGNAPEHCEGCGDNDYVDNAPNCIGK